MRHPLYGVPGGQRSGTRLHSMADTTNNIGIKIYGSKSYLNGIGRKYGWENPISEIGMKILVVS